MSRLNEFCELHREYLDNTNYTFADSIETTKVEAGTLSIDKDVTYEPLELAAKTIKRLRNAPDQGQKTAIKDWNAWYLQWKDEDIEKWDIQSLANIVCRMLFLETFTISFEWMRGLPDRVLADTEHKDIGVHIREDPSDGHVKNNMENYHQSILSTFIHEMIHGYFMTFCCDGFEECEGYCCKDGMVVWPEEYDDGHDLAWFLLSGQIDIFIRDYLDFGGDCSSFRSLVGGYKKGHHLSAGDWKLFFSTFEWDEVQTIFDAVKPGSASMRALWKMLERDKEVMKVWAEEGEEHE
jgi:hypothetical protein